MFVMTIPRAHPKSANEATDEGHGGAPSAEAAAMVHREAHGLLADRIYQVQEGE